MVQRLGFEQQLEALTWQAAPPPFRQGLVYALLSKAGGSGLAGIGLDAPAQARPSLSTLPTRLISFHVWHDVSGFTLHIHLCCASCPIES